MVSTKWLQPGWPEFLTGARPVNEIVDRLFLAHPRFAGQGYVRHLRFAWHVAGVMAGGALAALLHGVLPCIL